MENETSDVQPKCQGPLQLLSLPFLMTITTKQMRPNGRGALYPQTLGNVEPIKIVPNWALVVVVFGKHLYECVTPLANSLQSGLLVLCKVDCFIQCEFVGVCRVGQLK